MLLVDIAVRSALILTAALLTTIGMRRATAATRHLVWTLAVVSVLVLPALMVALPKWPVVPRSVRGLALAQIESMAAHAVILAGGQDRQRGSIPMAAGRTFGAADVSVGTADVALAIWGLVSCALVARVVAGVAAVRRIARHARPADTRCRELLLDIAAAAGLTKPIRLLMSADVTMPMTWGSTRPFLLLPHEAREWPDNRMRVVLQHEVAHIRRADWMTHALGRLVVACHWFNPLAWLALRAMTREREHACDDYVVAAGTSPTTYAQHLLDIARTDPITGPWAIAPAIARRTELEGRLIAILTPHPRRTTRCAAPLLMVATITAAALMATAAPIAPAIPQAARPVASAQRLSQMQAEQVAADREEAREERRVRRRLVAALENPSEDIREKAALALATRSGTDVVGSLLRALKDPSAQVREKAAMGLTFRRQPEVLDALLEAAEDEDAQVREKVVLALGAYRDARAVAAVTAAAEDPDEQVREKAVQGLALAAVTALTHR
jgi:beta-lactamase regulating signal transducer with metallopeptidase domain